MPVHIKGLVLKARVDYLQRFHGESGWGRLLAELSPEARSALSDGIEVGPLELRRLGKDVWLTGPIAAPNGGPHV